MMSSLRNLKTGTKLTTAFLVVAVLIITVATVGYVSVKSVNAAMTTLYADRLLPTQQLGRINDAQLKIQRNLYQYILVPEDRNARQRDIADYIQIAEKTLKQYEATYLVPDEVRGLVEFKPAWAAYLRTVEQAMQSVKAGNTTAALQSVREGGAVFAAQQTVDEIITRLIEVQLRVGVDLKQAGDRTFARVSAIMAVAGVLGVLLAVTLGVLMGRSITIPLARITGVATRIAGGNLDTSSLAKITSRDEIGILARTLARMAGQLKLTLERLHKSQDELEHRVRQRTAELETSNKELEAFSYSLAHDLRAPLRAINGFSKSLSTDYLHLLDEKGKEDLNRIRAATQRMGEMIDGLLNLSRFARSEMNVTAVNLSEIVRTIARELSDNDLQRKVTWTIADNVIVQADPVLIRIVLENLVDNAWKFTKKKESAQVTFGVEKQQGLEVYYIRDNGSGFDMRYAENNLFEPFRTLHSTRDYTGTGIGLVSCKRIIHRHRGRIWAYAEVDKGATFCFTLWDDDLKKQLDGVKES